MSSSGMLSTIEKLKGRENYDSWKFATKALFMMEGLWDCIEGEEARRTGTKRRNWSNSKRKRMVNWCYWSSR